MTGVTGVTGATGGDRQVIAIDGPSGTGKSSVAREVARRLRAGYLDTGAMYRALTFVVLDEGINPNDAAAVGKRAESLQIELETDPDQDFVAVDGREVTQQIRSSAVTAAVSAVSAVPAVRHRLVVVQRGLASSSTTVVEGRDIGTVVFPAARLKIYLTADSATRATRRAGQLGIDDPERIQALAESMRVRDNHDSSRAESPLHAAPDAVVLDSTNLTHADVVEAILTAALATGPAT